MKIAPINPPPLLRILNLGKRFGSVTALANVSLQIESGRIYGLAGENGAGKSTLVKILSGVHSMEEGQMELEGQPYAPRSPAAAERSGINVFHQEIPVCPNLSIAANVFLGPAMPRRGFRPDWARMERECAKCFEEWLGLAIDSRRLLRDCSIAERQLVLLVRVLLKQARLIILDEPTTALTPSEVANLFVIIRRLKAQGVALLLISHLLDELTELSDELYVLRDGRVVGHFDRPKFDPHALSELIAGRALSGKEGFAWSKPAITRFEIRDFSRVNQYQNVSFQVGAGEIVAIAGAQGSGRSELSRALFGSPPLLQGEVALSGQRLRIERPADALRAGIGYVPEDRKTLGLFHHLNIQTNIGLLKLLQGPGFGWLRRDLLRSLALTMQERLRIRMEDPEAPVTSLSGGNQQKLLIARCLSLKPQVLILNEPTRGVDVGAKDEIQRLLRRIAEEGTAIVIASSDLDELIQLADRILVMTQGRITAEFAAAAATKASLIQAIGQRKTPF